MKTKLIKALILMLLISSVFFAVSCTTQKPTSESTQSESLVESNTEESVSVHVCDYTELKYNSTHHWYECSCGEKDSQSEQEHAGGEATCQELAECTTCGQSYGSYGAHNMVDGACSICGKEESQGLEYELSSDGTYYVVIGIGTCADKDLIIPSAYNNLPVKEIGAQAFKNCTSLTSVVIGDCVTTIGEEAFSYCTSLTSVVLGDSVLSIGDYAFRYCYSLTSVVIGDSVTIIGYEAFYCCTSLTSVVIGDSVTTIGEWAFRSCTSLTSVEIPNSVTTIGYEAFSGCDSLTSIEVDANNTAYASIDGNLYNKDCTTLIQYAIGKENSEFEIPNSVTTIGHYAFEYCSSLASVVIGDSVLSIGEMAFYNCSSLTSVVVGDSVLSIGYYAFEDCDSLTSVVIPDSVTTIGVGAFRYCASLTSVVIGDSVLSIGDYAFYSCDSLTSVVIGDSVLSIGNYAFYGCSSLTSVVIGDNVTTIGDYAFVWCSSLTSIKYRGTEEQWQAISKGSYWNFNTGNYTITYNYQGE